MRKTIHPDETVTMDVLRKVYGDTDYYDSRRTYCTLDMEDEFCPGGYEVVLDSVSDEDASVSICMNDVYSFPVENFFAEPGSTVTLESQYFAVCSDRDVSVSFHVRKLEKIKSIDIDESTIPDYLRIGSSILVPSDSAFYTKYDNGEVSLATNTVWFDHKVEAVITNPDGSQEPLFIDMATGSCKDEEYHLSILDYDNLEVGKPIAFKLYYCGKSTTFTVDELKADEWAGESKESSTMEDIFGYDFTENAMFMDDLGYSVFAKNTISDVDNDGDGFIKMSELENVTELRICKNDVPYTDIDWVSKFPNLKSLAIYYGDSAYTGFLSENMQSYTDLSPLSGLKYLQCLSLVSSYGGNSLEGLGEHEHLVELYVSVEYSGDENIPAGVITEGLEPIGSLPNLQLCDITAVGVTDKDMQALGKCKKLEKINIIGNNQKVSTLDPIKDLKELKKFKLTNGVLSDISALEKLDNLTCLDLTANKITDISPISSCINLVRLRLAANKIAELPDLTGLTNLMYMSDNTCFCFNQIDIDDAKQKLPKQLVEDEEYRWFNNQNNITRYFHSTQQDGKDQLSITGNFPDSPFGIDVKVPGKNEKTYTDMVERIQNDNQLGFADEEIKAIIDINLYAGESSYMQGSAINLKGESSVVLNNDYGVDFSKEYHVFIDEGDRIIEVGKDTSIEDKVNFKTNEFGRFIIVQLSPTQAPTATPVPTATEAPTQAPPTTPVPAATEAPTLAPTQAPPATPVPTQVPPKATAAPAKKIKLATVGITSVIAKKKLLKVTWKKVKGADGYELRYSNTTRKAMNKKRILKKTTITLRNLKIKSHFIKVRAFYLDDDDKKCYGKYSAIKIAKPKSK